jgi:hypothetical protein
MEECVGSEMYRLIPIRILKCGDQFEYYCQSDSFNSGRVKSWSEIKQKIDEYWDNFVVFSRRT